MANTLPALIARRISEDYIANGRISPGGQLPSVRELQAQYDVSSTTIVNALSVLAAQGLLQKQHGRGTFVTERSAANSGKQLDAVGFVVPAAVSVGCLMSIYAGVERAGRRHGWDVLLATADYSYETERQQVARLIQAGCRGIVLNPVTRMRTQLRDDYLKTEFRDFPIVLVDIAYPEQARSQVVFDNYRAGYDMTEFLLSEGHRRIAFIDAEFPQGGEPMHRSTHERLRGYRDALRAVGIASRAADHWRMHLIVDEHEDEAESLLLKWKDMKDRPTAVIALHDGSALDLVHAARALGYDVPEELRVVGFDNLGFGRSGRPLFPTTDPDFGRAGEIAVELLAQHMRGELDGSVVYMLPVPLRTDTGEIRKVAEAEAVGSRPRAPKPL